MEVAFIGLEMAQVLIECQFLILQIRICDVNID